MVTPTTAGMGRVAVVEPRHLVTFRGRIAHARSLPDPRPRVCLCLPDTTAMV